MKKTLLTFASSDMKRSVRRLCRQAEEMGVFDTIIGSDERDLSGDFKKRFQAHLKRNTKGFGYWCWKPQIVLQSLQDMEEGDILLYLDAGCHLNIRGTWRMQNYIDVTKDAASGVLGFQARAPELPFSYDGRSLLDLRDCRWIKGDLLDYFDLRAREDILQSQTIGAGIIFFRKCARSLALLNDWKAVIESDFALLDDTPSVSDNHPEFVAHRHDQAIFSILGKLNEIETVSAYEYWYPLPGSKKPDWEALKEYPILAMRDKDLGPWIRQRQRIKRKLRKVFKFNES